MNERMYQSMLKEYSDVLSISEVAKILRIGKNKAYELVNSGKLQSIRIGGKIIVPKMCLIRFLLDENNYIINPK